LEAQVKRTVISAILGVLTLGATTPGFSQASQPDAQTVQAILSELQSIHKDMRVTAISQILLIELQTQQSVVNTATERVSNARRDLTNLQADEKRASADLAELQDKRNNTSDAVEAETFTATVNNLKSGLAAFKVREDGLTTTVQTAESQLRSAQETLDDIQRRLDETMKKLQPVADTH
jgi:chromosome segregation ATPase